MELDDKYSVDADSHQFMLKRKNGVISKGDKKGQFSYDYTSYGTLASVLKKYLELDIKHSVQTTSDIHQLIKSVDSLNEKVEEIAENIDLNIWKQLKTLQNTQGE